MDLITLFRVYIVGHIVNENTNNKIIKDITIF